MCAGLLPWRAGLDSKRVDAFDEQFREGVVHCTLPCHPAHSGKGRGFDFNREMALAAIGVVAAMAAMFLAVVNDLEVRWAECFGKTFGDFRGYRAG